VAAVIADQAGYRSVFVLLAVLAAIGAADALLGGPPATIDRHPISDPPVLLAAGLKVILRAGVLATFTLLTTVLAAVTGIHGPAVPGLWRGAVIGALAARGRDARSALLASVALTAAFAAALPLIHGSVAGAAGVLALVGASAGAADASTRILIADPVVDETAGLLGIGLAGVVAAQCSARPGQTHCRRSQRHWRPLC
jgi:predicted MFS family arabinose efflux permease